MKEGRDLVKEAVKDAKSLKEAALEAARNEIIEGMAPKLKALLDESIRGALNPKKEDVDRLRRGVEDNWPGESHTGFEEAKDKGDKPMDMDSKKKDDQELDMESLAGFFAPIAEDPAADQEEGAYEGAPMGIPTLGEEPHEDPMMAMPGEEDPMNPMKKEETEAVAEGAELDEEIEISEAELRKVYEAALQTEVQVKKGFSDMSKAGELDEVDPGAGLLDVKKGEAGWEKTEPPAKEDYTVKEAILRGLAENKQLRENLKKAVGLIKMLGGKLHEVNLFNAKVLHVNRILNRARLTKEQKRVVMESIDKARSIDEVKMVYETIVSSFQAAQALAEAKSPRKPAANAQRARTSGTPKQEVLSESVDRANDGGKYARLRELAGLVK